MILLTGASGFIGKHLLNALIKEYGSEYILALTSKPLAGANCLLHDNYNFAADYFTVKGFSNKITTIIHAGAFTPKTGSQANDAMRCDQNIHSTETILRSKLPNLEKVIFLSTLDVYGHDEIITESTSLYPISLYGSSKLSCEKLLAHWAETNNKKFQVLRLGHVYGPGEETYQKIIPVIFRKILNKEPIEIWGSGEDKRSFINIKDVVSAIINSINLKENVGPINLVSDQAITINDLVKKILIISGGDNKINHISTNAEVRNLVFDNKKLKTHLLRSEISLDEGLKEEFSYMKKQFSNG